jgi:hypothetical protein
MRWNDWQELHRELQSCPWFAHVGKPLENTSSNLRTIASWDLASEWASAEISWWCVNEASNVLSLHLSTYHRMEYRKWNEHIKSFAPHRDELLERVVSPLVPGGCRQSVVEWIRSHLTSAYLECIYSKLSDIHLVRDQIEWYLRGRFPCGWLVKDEASFPNEAITVIF